MHSWRILSMNAPLTFCDLLWGARPVDTPIFRVCLMAMYYYFIVPIDVLREKESGNSLRAKLLSDEDYPAGTAPEGTGKRYGLEAWTKLRYALASLARVADARAMFLLLRVSVHYQGLSSFHPMPMGEGRRKVMLTCDEGWIEGSYWSAGGITFEAMDVLHPDGIWHSLTASQCLHPGDPPPWKRVPVNTSEPHLPSPICMWSGYVDAPGSSEPWLILFVKRTRSSVERELGGSAWLGEALRIAWAMSAFAEVPRVAYMQAMGAQVLGFELKLRRLSWQMKRIGSLVRALGKSNVQIVHIPSIKAVTPIGSELHSLLEDACNLWDCLRGDHRWIYTRKTFEHLMKSAEGDI